MTFTNDLESARDIINTIFRQGRVKHNFCSSYSIKKLQQILIKHASLNYKILCLICFSRYVSASKCVNFVNNGHISLGSQQFHYIFYKKYSKFWKYPLPINISSAIPLLVEFLKLWKLDTALRALLALISLFALLALTALLALLAILALCALLRSVCCVHCAAWVTFVACVAVHATFTIRLYIRNKWTCPNSATVVLILEAQKAEIHYKWTYSYSLHESFLYYIHLLLSFKINFQFNKTIFHHGNEVNWIQD